MTGTWFNRHERFGDCKPNEVYIGQGTFAEFFDGHIWLRNNDQRILIDQGSVSILSGASAEWERKRR
jgi:hypothetical protein